MNKKAVSKLLIIGVAIVVVVVIGVVAYWTLTKPAGTGEQTGGEETGGETAPNVAGASSLQYEVIATIEGEQERFKFMAKNLGTPNAMMRVEFTDAEGNVYTYILNGALQKAWLYSEGAWVDLSYQYSDLWNSWKFTFDGYVGALQHWTGVGSYEYKDNGNTFKITNILVNPALADSLFQP